MKQIYEGYIPKDQINEKWFEWEIDYSGAYFLSFNYDIGCFKNKGKESNWLSQEYPPKKVKITIEIEDWDV